MLHLTVDLASDTPLYEQLANGLRVLIAQGGLAPGDALPSVRALGQATGVNLNTVAKAYRILADEGLVELRQGAGARVAPRTGSRVAAEPVDERLDELLSRWVLAGNSRAEIESALGAAVERFFNARRST